MLLAEPQPTPADLRFTLAASPCRCRPGSGWRPRLLRLGVCRSLAGGDQRELLRYLVAWVARCSSRSRSTRWATRCAYRACGQTRRSVLYHFGAPDCADSVGRRRRPAPPGSSCHLGGRPLRPAGVARLPRRASKAGGSAVAVAPCAGLGERLGLDAGRPLESRFVFALAWFLLQVDIFWPILNLMPVPPLDGGQMVRDGLLTIGVRDAVQIADVVGIGVGGLVAWWAYSRGEPYLGIMFAMLAVSCFKTCHRRRPLAVTERGLTTGGRAERDRARCEQRLSRPRAARGHRARRRRPDGSRSWPPCHGRAYGVEQPGCGRARLPSILNCGLSDSPAVADAGVRNRRPALVTDVVVIELLYGLGRGRCQRGHRGSSSLLEAESCGARRSLPGGLRRPASVRSTDASHAAEAGSMCSASGKAVENRLHQLAVAR